MDEGTIDNIRVVDFNMPFPQMVLFMVKLTLASIPAAIIVFLIGLVAASVFAGFIAGL